MQRAKREAYQSINVGPTADQSQLVWYKAYGLLQGPKASWLVADVKMTPFPTITFINGAVFQARSTAGDGRHLLGHDYDDVNWDEAAYEPRFQTILDNVLRMRLVDRAGKLDFTSTGNGRNPFGQYFLTGLPGEKKDPNLYSQTGSTRQNPNVDQSRVDKLALRMPERMRQQNIDGLIVDGGGNYFSLDDLNAVENRLLNEHMQYRLDEDGNHEYAELQITAGQTPRPYIQAYGTHRYMHGWDLADKKDWMVGFTIDLSVTPFRIVEFERFQKKGWDHNYAMIRARDRKYKTPNATKIDSTGLGDVVENELKDIGVEGVSFGGAGKKDALLVNHQSAMSTRAFEMPYLPVVHNEHAFYERQDDDLDTDCVMGLVVLMWFAKRTDQAPFYVSSI